MQINNQKPVDLSPIYTSNILNPFDPVDLLKTTVVDPLFTPLNPNGPVQMISNQNAINEDDVTSIILTCLGDAIEPAAETASKEILQKTLLDFDSKNPMPIKMLFVTQSGTKAGLPAPSDKVVYTPMTDVIPTSKKFLAGKASYDEWFASMAYYTRCETLGFYFATAQAFEDFKQWFATQHNTLANALPADTNNLVSQFMQLTLNGLTEGIRLRSKDDENNEPGSFARLLPAMLMNYTRTAGPGEFGCMPFDVGELFCPLDIIFVNVEQHARAVPQEITNEWKLIKQAQSIGPRMISNKQLTKLTATVRNMKKIQANAVRASKQMQGPVGKKANVRFKKSPLTTTDMTKLIKKVLDKMAQTNKSENVYKQVKPSFARANRRDPDDFNKQGKIVSTKYKPDIHLYVDTSSSISERNYQDAIKACIHMAKKFNINLYFNSFSHILSQTTHLRTKDRSTKEVYRQFQKVKKLSGGTDYANIWKFINKSPKRKRELSLLITDFEYYAPTEYIPHPKNLYYLPCSKMNYDWIVRSAEDFCASMEHNDPNIRKHLLF